MDQYRKSLSKAFFFSMALHAVILVGAIAFAHYGSLLRGQDLHTITVSLVSGRGAGEASASGHAAPLRPEHPREKALPEAAEAPKLERREEHDEATPFSAGAAADGSAHVASAGTPVADGAAGSAGTDVAAVAGGFSSEQWQQLHIALERVKTYPRLARERGIEGTVLVRFKVQPTGGIERVDIVKSSGVKILDDASVSTVYRAAPVPYIDGWIEVPMVYQLKRSEVR